MASQILLKKSTTASAVPTTSDVAVGEVAVNTEDKRLFTKDSGGTVVELGITPSSLTTSGTIQYGSLSDGTITVTAFVDEDDMSSNSASLVPTQQSVKAYVDSQVASKDDLSELTGDTDDVSEGTTNLYYTDARANTAIDTRVNKAFVDTLNVDADTLDGVDSTGFATAAQGALADSALQAETNDLTAAVTWANVPNANITQSSVTQHQAALSITESQISDLQSYLTAETNDLSSAVTWANVPDANITQSSVTQHQAALSITESQISDLGPYDPAGTAVALAIALG